MHEASWPLPRCAIRAEALAISSLFPSELNAPCLSQQNPHWDDTPSSYLPWDNSMLVLTVLQQTRMRPSIDILHPKRTQIHIFTATIVQPSRRYSLFMDDWGQNAFVLTQYSSIITSSDVKSKNTVLFFHAGFSVLNKWQNSSGLRPKRVRYPQNSWRLSIRKWYFLHALY